MFNIGVVHPPVTTGYVGQAVSITSKQEIRTEPLGSTISRANTMFRYIGLDIITYRGVAGATKYTMLVQQSSMPNLLQYTVVVVVVASQHGVALAATSHKA